MKKLLLLLIITIFILSGCSQFYTHNYLPPISSPTKEEELEFNEAKSRFYDENTGRIYTDISDMFDFKVYKWEAGKQNDKESNTITLDIGIWNKSGKFLNNIDLSFKWNEEGVRIIGNGITHVNIFEPVDLYCDRLPTASSYAVQYNLTPTYEPANKGLDAEFYLDKLSELIIFITVDNIDYELNIDLGPIKYLNEITY